MVAAYQGVIQDGQLRLNDGEELPDGTRVIVVVMDKVGEPVRPAGITGAEILESGIVGMWADREDITDSAEFARQLRRKAEQRGGDD